MIENAWKRRTGTATAMMLSPAKVAKHVPVTALIMIISALAAVTKGHLPDLAVFAGGAADCLRGEYYASATPVW
jgi:hypothetical protein